MKFSELWLREWIDIAIDSEALSDQITMVGLKVDSIEPVSGQFHGVVIGEIIECNKELNTNNLRLTKVNIGSEHLLSIICSAPNCRKGIKVAVATIGAVLPNNSEIKVTEKFGKLSEGILCSYSELNIFDSHINIIELPIDAPIGVDIRDYLNLNDNMITISVTPNRADCLSIIGIARDLAALNKINLNIPKITPVQSSINDTLSIHVNATDACPRYVGRIVKGIDIKALTPLWMKEKLRRCGISSINAVVDITNYVLIELGQPMHIFDKDHIDGGIIVRMAKKEEKIILLNRNEVKLNVDTLVIADYTKVLAIGCIFDNKYSNVNNETKNLMLECAFFNPLFITNRTHRHGYITDGSYRCERGVDSMLQYKAMDRATRLLIDICGGQPGPVINITNEETLPKCITITLSRKKLDRLIGHHINDMQVNDILHRLGYTVTKCQSTWEVIAPSWRFDIKIEEDLIEEIARIYGYNNIPNKPIQTHLMMRSHHETHLSLNRVKTLLNDKGYQEVMTYSFVNSKVQKLIHPGEESLILPHPISSEMSAMRISLWTGLLKTIIDNQNRQQNRIRIFEIGLCFIPDTESNLNVRQDMTLAGAIYGNRYKDHWSLKKIDSDFYDIKGDLESILDLTGKLSEITFRAESVPALHPGQSAVIYMKRERIGFIGVVHPKLGNKLNLKNRTMIFELKWDKISNRVIPRIQNISRFPENRRDISIIVPESIPAIDILTECKKININQIVDVNLFDVYCGKGVAKGFKSLAISLILQDTRRTLKEKEITAIVTKCIEALKERFQALLRD